MTEEPAVQGSRHWKVVDGRGVTCQCHLDADHDADENDVSAAAVPQRHETGE